jgi:hypothetical protein
MIPSTNTGLFIHKKTAAYNRSTLLYCLTPFRPCAGKGSEHVSPVAIKKALQKKGSFLKATVLAFQRMVGYTVFKRLDVSFTSLYTQGEAGALEKS